MKTVFIVLIVIGILILCIMVAEFIGFFIYGFNFERFVAPHLYKTFLPENGYPMSKERKMRVKKGKNRIANSSVVIYALCRDNEKRYEKSKDLLETLGKQFKDYDIVLFENDSKDSTRSLLKEWVSSNPEKVHLLECEDLGDCDCRLGNQRGYDMEMLDRLDKMAFYRNRCLDYIKNNSKLSQSDYIIAYDFDLEGGLLLSGFHDSFGYDDWTAMFANGRMRTPPLAMGYNMYDSLAYIGNNSHKKMTNWQRYQQLGKLKQNINGDLIPVQSAFNGFGIYKTKPMLESSYGKLSEPLLACEHIYLNFDLYNKGYKLYINPSMLIVVGIQGSTNKLAAAFYQYKNKL